MAETQLLLEQLNLDYHNLTEQLCKLQETSPVQFDVSVLRVQVYQLALASPEFGERRMRQHAAVDDAAAAEVDYYEELVSYLGADSSKVRNVLVEVLTDSEASCHAKCQVA